MHRPKSAASHASRTGITRYLQLYTLLAQELADGRFRPDQPLPSEPDLVKAHRVSRTTVRRALGRLEREGRIVRRRGSGTYARQKKGESPLAFAIQQFCEMKANGTRAKRLPGPAPVPMSLQSRYPALGAGTKVTRRLRSNGADACQLECVYLCKGATGREARVEGVKHELSAVAADTFAARHLRVLAGTPLLRLRTEFNARDGQLLAVTENLFRSDRASLHLALANGRKTGRWRLKAR